MPWLFLILTMALIGCADRSAAPAPSAANTAPQSSTQQPSPPKATLLPPGPAASEYPHLHNLLRVTDRIYSGGEPADEEAFASLAKLGVKTVVSVDGAKPNVEAAKRHGLRYVHIPIGYDGVPPEAGQALARVVRDVEGPIYVHCHHGNHRGPAAAAIACVAAGAADGKEALEVLKRAGTSKNYPGLWRDVENYLPPAPDAKLPALVETAEVSSLAAAMAQIDRAYDNVKLCKESKWRPPPDHPDLVPAQEALLIEEGLHEIARTMAADWDEQFKTWLAEAEQHAKAIRAALKNKSPAEADKHCAALEASCKQCHKKYRD